MNALLWNDGPKLVQKSIDLVVFAQRMIAIKLFDDQNSTPNAFLCWIPNHKIGQKKLFIARINVYFEFLEEICEDAFESRILIALWFEASRNSLHIWAAMAALAWIGHLKNVIEHVPLWDKKQSI